jgi:mannose-1-phosphate guanylyltransferase/phosphomannomutase
MKAIIIAGGKGERLRPLTDTVPKPMIEVGGKPILERTINLFIEHGVREFIISVCYLPKIIVDYFEDGKRFGVDIQYIYEDENIPLGTAGNIAAAKQFVDTDVIVTYADILRDIDIHKMIGLYKEKDAFGMLNIYKRFGANPKSKVIFDDKKQIMEFIERPGCEDVLDDFVWCNGSFYIFKPEIFDYLPQNARADFGKDIFPMLLNQKKPLFVYQSDGYFIDIGNKEKLEEARRIYSRSLG